MAERVVLSFFRGVEMLRGDSALIDLQLRLERLARAREGASEPSISDEELNAFARFVATGSFADLEPDRAVPIPRFEHGMTVFDPRRDR